MKSATQTGVLGAGKKKHPGGRPTKYQKSMAEQARKLCLLGYTDTELADFFDVAESTIHKWKLDHSEFSESLKKGKQVADSEVVDSLYHRALGYSHPDVHVTNYQGDVTMTPIIKHYPPDPTSAIFWLKNRQKEKWRDRTVNELVGKDDGPIQTETVTDYGAIREKVRAKRADG